MKRVLILGVMMLTAVFLVMGTGMAQMGSGEGPGEGVKPGGGLKPGDGSGLADLLLDAEPFTITGTITEVKYHGRITVDVEGTAYFISGIGPYHYWEEQGVERPDVGDEVTVEGYIISLVIEENDLEVYLAITVTLSSGEEVPLRDPVTGEPYWRRHIQQEPPTDPAGGTV